MTISVNGRVALRRLVVAAVIVLVAPSASGCGKAHQDVAAPVQAYLRDLWSGPAAAACDTLTTSAQRNLIRYLALTSPGYSRYVGGKCEKAVNLLLSAGSADLAATGVMSNRAAQNRRGPNVEVTVKTVTGDRATAQARGSTKTVQLVRVNGAWKIEQLDFSDASPRRASQRPRYRAGATPGEDAVTRVG